MKRIEIWMIYFLVLFSVGVTLHVAQKTEIKQENNINDDTDPVIIDLSIWDYINQCKLQHPEIVYAQAKLETSNFTSVVFKNNNNLFGMKQPKYRPTTALLCDSNNGYAYYENWKQSINDYALWQAIYGYNLTKTQYLKLLDSIYAEDSLYVSKINYILNK